MIYSNPSPTGTTRIRYAIAWLANIQATGLYAEFRDAFECELAEQRERRRALSIGDELRESDLANHVSKLLGADVERCKALAREYVQGSPYSVAFRVLRTYGKKAEALLNRRARR